MHYIDIVKLQHYPPQPILTPFLQRHKPVVCWQRHGVNPAPSLSESELTFQPLPTRRIYCTVLVLMF